MCRAKVDSEERRQCPSAFATARSRMAPEGETCPRLRRNQSGLARCTRASPKPATGLSRPLALSHSSPLRQTGRPLPTLRWSSAKPPILIPFACGSCWRPCVRETGDLLATRQHGLAAASSPLFFDSGPCDEVPPSGCPVR